jgi:hypothetical protein
MSGYAEWNPIVVYNVNDIVFYNSDLWVSLQNLNLNNIPGGVGNFWASTTGGGGGVATVNSGTGISITGTPSAPIVNTNVSAGTGISIAGSAPLIISSTCVQSVSSAGTGITIGGTATNPTIQNDGVLSVGAGSGIASTGGQNPSISNTGVLSVNSQTGAVSLTSSGSTVAITNPAPGVINLEQAGGGGTLTGISAGSGIAVSGSAPVPTVSNTGVLSVSAGTGISSTGGQTPSIANTGVLSVGAGSGIASTGGQNPSISNTGTLNVFGGIGITIAGPSTGPTVNATGVLDVYSGKGVVANYINSPNTQTVSLNYRPDQAVVDNPNFIIMDSANNGFVDGRNAPLNATLLQYPGTYYIREADYASGPDLQAWVLVQTGTAPAPGAVVSPSGAIYTVFNANPVGTNNITNLNFSYLSDNTFSPGLTSPLATPQQISPNQSVSFMVNYLPTQGAGGTSADFTRPVITWLNKNSISGVPA